MATLEGYPTTADEVFDTDYWGETHSELRVPVYRGRNIAYSEKVKEAAAAVLHSITISEPIEAARGQLFNPTDPQVACMSHINFPYTVLLADFETLQKRAAAKGDDQEAPKDPVDFDLLTAKPVDLVQREAFGSSLRSFLDAKGPMRVSSVSVEHSNEAYHYTRSVQYIFVLLSDRNQLQARTMYSCDFEVSGESIAANPSFSRVPLNPVVIGDTYVRYKRRKVFDAAQRVRSLLVCGEGTQPQIPRRSNGTFGKFAR